MPRPFQTRRWLALQGLGFVYKHLIGTNDCSLRNLELYLRLSFVYYTCFFLLTLAQHAILSLKSMFSLPLLSPSYNSRVNAQ